MMRISKSVLAVGGVVLAGGLITVMNPKTVHAVAAADQGSRRSRLREQHACTDQHRACREASEAARAQQMCEHDVCDEREALTHTPAEQSKARPAGARVTTGQADSQFLVGQSHH